MKMFRTIATGFLSALVLVGLMAQAPSVSISKLGDTYYADKFGVVCDGDTNKSTANTAALNALNTRIMATSTSTGKIVLPAGTCKFNGQWVIGSLTSPGIGHVSVEGASPYATVMSWTGLNGGSTGTPAIFVTRNKEFTIGGFALVNTVNLSGQYDTGSNVGIRFGGLPSIGTQTFGYVAKQLLVSNFDTCMHLGANNGSAASDSIYDDLAFTYCNQGFLAQGANNLDFHLRNVLIALNKVGIASNSGNLSVRGGSASYNGIDFRSSGFGYFSIEDMRSEGPGRFFYGNEPNLMIRNVTVAEVQGSRPLTGDYVSCAPDNARNVTLTVFTAPAVGGVYPIEFGSGDITAADIGRPIMVQLSNQVWFAGRISAVADTTHASLTLTAASVSSGSLEADTNVVSTVYSAQTCDLQFSTSALTKNDVGANIMSSSGGLTTSNGGLARIWVNSISSTTTGKGYFTHNVGGNVPLLTTQPSALSAAEGAAGNVNVGTHKYYVTCIIDGIETKGGSEGTVTVSTSAKQVDLTNIPTCTNATARRVYRTAAGVTGVTNAKLLSNGIIDDNVTTILTDNDSDATLASGFPGDDVSRSLDLSPVLFDNIGIEITAVSQQVTIENVSMKGAMLKLRDGNGSTDIGNLRLTNNKMMFGPIGQAAYPVFSTQADLEFQITGTAASVPDVSAASGTIHTTGIQFPGSEVDQTFGQMRSNFLINAFGNVSSVFNDLEHVLPDFMGRLVHGRLEPFFYMPRSIQGDTATGMGSAGNQYAAGIGIRPEVQLSRITSLGEFQAVAGKNLRTWCTFAASTTCDVDFKRDESVTFAATGSDVSSRTREVRYSVASGTFDIADLGKVISLPVTSTSLGTRTAYGWISRIEDATHIWAERAAGELPMGSQGTSYGPVTASIGEDEPDTNYLIFLACDDETVGYKTGSKATTGFTITASGSTSARCSVLIVR